MENNLTLQPSTSYFTMTSSSPSSSASCFAVHDDFNYSRIHCSGDPHGGATAGNNHNNSNTHSKSGVRRKWKNILKRLIKESKIACGSNNKPVSFKYDPVSYSQNFDDDSHLHEPHRLFRLELFFFLFFIYF